MSAVSATVAILVLSLAAGVEVGRVAWGTGDWLGGFSLSWGLGFAAAVLVVGLVDLLALAAIWAPTQVVGVLNRWLRGPCGYPRLRLVTAVIFALLPGLLVYYTPIGLMFSGLWVRVFLVATCLGAATILVGGTQRGSWYFRFVGIALCCGAGLVLAREFSMVTDYPFSLSWSEGNRLWDYSLMFGRDRYIIPSDANVSAYISPGRQFLWGLVFLVPGASIALARLWSALVLTIPYVILGWAAIGGGGALKRGLLVGFAVWSLVFLSQGPIYTPLILSAILAVWAVHQRRFWLGMVLVGVASYYASISRWTWLFAPGIWAGMLTLLDEPDPEADGPTGRPLARAIAFGVAGWIGGWLLPVITSHLSQSPAPMMDVGAAVRRQPLLWYRLLPNPTFGPGILVALALATGPVFAAWIWLWKRGGWRVAKLQLAVLLIALLGFLAVGLVVSAKIGGGSNLHNLDMLLTTIVLLTGAILRAPGGEARAALLARDPVGRRLVVIALVMPMALTVQGGGPLVLPDRETAEAALAVIRAQVAGASRDGEVLFYDQRQLLTFGYVTDVPLVAEYEKKFMADQALSGDVSAFASFYHDLAQQRFALIVSPPLELTWKEDHPFSEEDEAQVRLIYRPMAEYYEPAVRLDAVGVWLLRPRTGHGEATP